MRYRFDSFVLDVEKRELLRSGQPVALLPQVFELLRLLIEQRERALSKRELLALLWPDTVVSEGSLQRVVSLLRAALGDAGHELVRTLSGHGYRFAGEVTGETGASEPPDAATLRLRVRYAQRSGVHVAYATLGEGEVDLVLVLGWTFPMQALTTLPEARNLLDQLSQLGRVVVFDKRGTGLSDRVRELPDLDARIDDLRAVLDAVGSQRAILLGISEGGPLSIAFAALYPERVAGLVLVGSFARMASAPDHDAGWKRSTLSDLRAYVQNGWGQGATMLALLPEARRESARAWACDAEQAGASPGAALDLLDMNVAIDVRGRLAQVRAPTYVLHARADRVSNFAQGSYLAQHISGARLVGLDSDDHAFMFDGQETLLAAVRGLLEHEARRDAG